MSTALSLTEPPVKVLIVEDEVPLRESIVFRFEREGFDVLQASNGIEALSILCHEIPDIILTDVRMPKMNGKEFLQSIREKFEPATIPIIFCITGYSDLTEKDAAELWVDRYFQKPFDPSVLIAASRADVAKLRSKIQLKNSFLSFLKDENYEGFVVAAMMHEINNLLNIGKFSSAQLNQHFENFIPDTKINKAVTRIDSIFGRMQGIASVLTRVIRNQDVTPETLSIVQVLKHISDEAKLRFPNTVIHFDNECPHEQRMTAVPFSPQIIMFNILKNAYEAQSDDDKILSISVRCEGNCVVYRVSNPGTISDDVVERLFDPYFSTKKDSSQSGMGIGLAIAKDLIKSSGGSIELESHRGTVVFKITFPGVA